MDEAPACQASNVFPVGNPAAVRRGPERGAFPAGDFLDEEGFDDLGGVPALRFRGGEDVGGGGPHVRQPHPAEQGFQIGRQGWCDGHAGRCQHFWVSC